MTDPTKNASPLVRTGDKGGDGKLKDGQLDKFKAELRHIVTRAGSSVVSRRRAAEAVRFCRWEGQSADGRKHKDNLKEEAFPWEGASDAVIRLADMVVNENKRIGLTAIRNFGLRGVDAASDGTAGRMTRLANWLIKNRLTQTWHDEWERVLEHGIADSPAVAAMGVFWEQRTMLVDRTITIEDVVGVVQGDVARAQALIYDPTAEADALALLAVLLPGADAGALKKALAALATEGSASVTVPELVASVPCIQAMRYMDDVFNPENTTRFDAARMNFHREWLSEVQLEERVLNQGYDAKAVKQVLEHEGRTFLPLIADRTRLASVNATWRGVVDAEAYRGLYEIITAYYYAVNNEGIPALYTVVFHGSVDTPVRERELCPYAHGKYPFAFYTYERISARAWESRGIPELVSTDQFTIKLHTDAINDNATIASNPPVKRPENREDFRLIIQPFGEVFENRPGEISYMTGPAYPATAQNAAKDALARVSSYFGRPVEGVTPQQVVGYAQGFVDRFLPTVAEVIHQLVANACQFMSAEELERIVPGLGAYAGMDPRELRGRYDFIVSFDARTLDIEWLKTLGELFGKYVLAWDTLSTVDRGKAVSWFAAKLDSDTLDFIRPSETAAIDELKDEDANFAFIAAGGEPPMVDSGQNFAARAQRLEMNVMKNPESVASWPPKNREVLQARLEHLHFMAEQQENADIGRKGAEPVLGQ